MFSEGKWFNSGGFDTRLIENSVWFDGSADFLSAELGAKTRTKAVIGTWIQKTGFTTSDATFFSKKGSAQFAIRMLDQSSGKISIFDYDGGSFQYSAESTTMLLRDIGWYHIMISIDTTASAGSRLKYYINGIDRTDTLTVATDYTLNDNPNITGGSGEPTQWGVGYTGTSQFNPCYLAQSFMLDDMSIQNGDVAVSDILESFEFGSGSGSQFGPQSNSDITTLAANAFGSNSFALDFSDSAHLGHDSRPHNFLNYSEQFDQWTAAGTTVTANNMSGPFGNFVADKVATTSAGTYKYITQTPVVSDGIAGKTITISTYVYADTTFNFVIRTRGTGSTQEALNSTVSTVAGEWTRVSVTRTFTSSADGTGMVVTIYTDHSVSGQSHFWLFGAQVEQGTLSPYVPTPKNILRMSEDFTAVGYWGTHSNFTKTADQTTAPDGTNTADLLTKTATAGGWIGQTNGATRGGATTFTWSCFAKKSVGNYFAMRLQSPYPDRMDAVFNIDTGEVHNTSVTNFTNISASITDKGNGWYRCSVTGTTPSSTSFIYNSNYVDCNSNGGFLGNTDSVSNSAVFVWGAQLEYGTAVTSYVKKTTTNAVNVVPNNFTSTSMSAANQSSHTPSLEFPTLNPLNGDASLVAALAYGNRLTTTYTHDSGVAWDSVFATRSMGRTGKYYFETYINRDDGGNGFPSAIHETDTANKAWSNYIGNTTATYGLGYGLYSHASYYTNGGSNSIVGYATAGPLAAGDIAMMAVDLDNSKIYWGKNGTFFNSGDPANNTGESATIQANTDYIFGVSPPVTEDYFVNFGADSTFGGAISAGGNSDSRGVGDFKYAVPTGFLSLASAALDTPDLQGVDNFSVTLGTEAAIAPTENINPYSENATLNYTNVQSATITSNFAPDPNGILTADKIEDTSTSVTQYTQRNLTIPTGTDTWTWSFYIQKDSNTSRRPRFALGLHNGGVNQLLYCYLNTSTGVVENATGAAALTSAVSESVGDYWRLALTGTNNGANNLIYTQVYPAHSTTSSQSSVPSLTGSVVFAHSQIIKNETVPTSYIPTYSSTAASLPYSHKLDLIDGTTTENYIRNNTMEGVSAGTPGTLPTNWYIGNGGATIQIVGYGVTADGIEYIDIKFSGTPTWDPYVAFETNTGIPALAGEEWTYSVYSALQAGSLTNLTSTAQLQLQLNGRDSSGNYVNFSGQKQLTPTSALVRHEFTTTLSGSTVRHVYPRFGINWDGSGAIDATFRIGNPQMEKRSSASPIIKTGAHTMRQNFLAYSEQLDQWINTNTVRVANALVAPDGSQTADTIAQGTGSTYPQNDGIRADATLLPSTLYTFSGYFKHSESNTTGLHIGNYANSPTAVALILYTWSGGSPTLDSSTNASNIVLTDVGNGWHRLSFSFTTFANASQTNQFYLYPRRQSAEGTDVVGMWGMQVEIGSTANEYIPTNGAAVYEPTKRTSLNSFVEIQKNRDAAETFAWRFNDYNKEYAFPNSGVNTAAAYQDIRDQTGTNNWVSYALKIAAASGTAAGAVSHGFATGATTVTHSLASNRYIVLLFNRSGGDIFYYHPDVTAGSLLKFNSNVLPFSSTVITNITSNSFDIGSGSAQAVYDYLVIAETPGVIDIFKYIGNNSSAGPYISLNAMPEFWTAKLITTHLTEHVVLDQTRSPINDSDIPYLLPNQNVAESNNTAFAIDFLAGAVKIRNASTDLNFASGGAGGTLVGFSFGKIAGGGSLPPIYAR